VRGLNPPEPTSSDGVRLDAAIRCSFFCVAVGALLEPDGALFGSTYESVTASTDVVRALAAACTEGMLGATADLDPMDRGPAHLALPATVATAVAGALSGSTDALVRRGVFEGLELAARVRATLAGARPGGGFHSVGVFGTLAAALGAARAFGASDEQAANAAGIALSRAGGLSLNSAATKLGMSHFGWAAAHGLEAGWLAASGMAASLDVNAALRAFYPDAALDLVAAEAWAEEPIAPERTYFKRYPCNVYLNLVAEALRGIPREPERIAVTLPQLPHLDQPFPGDLRAARNSVQAVAALAALGQVSYSSFDAGLLDGSAGSRVRDLMTRTEVVLDGSVPTDLASTTVSVEAWSDGRSLLERTVDCSVLGPWNVEHAAVLVDGVPGADRLLAQFSEEPVRHHELVSAAVVERCSRGIERDEVLT
jgi:2-methylcitrate dehydratase PrpD